MRELIHFFTALFLFGTDVNNTLALVPVPYGTVAPQNLPFFVIVFVLDLSLRPESFSDKSNAKTTSSNCTIVPVCSRVQWF